MTKHILFDFDGVIVDTFDLSFAVAQLSRPWLTADEYREWFNGNVYESIAKDAREPIAQYASNDSYFKEYCVRLENVVPYPGMREIIADLASRHKLSIITSCYDTVIVEFLEKHGLHSFFSDVLGAQTDRSKINKMKTMLTKYQHEPQEFLFITDTVGDIREAAHVGIPAIGVTWGTHSRTALEGATPTRIVETPAELMGL